MDSVCGLNLESVTTRLIALQFLELLEVFPKRSETKAENCVLLPSLHSSSGVISPNFSPPIQPLHMTFRRMHLNGK